MTFVLGKWETLQIQVSHDECLFLVRAAGQMKAFQWDVVRLISKRDIVWFLKHGRIQFGSGIYSTRCALNGKLEKKFSLKHGFFSTEKSIIQNREEWIFFFFFFLGRIRQCRLSIKFVFGEILTAARSFLFLFFLKTWFKDSPPRLWI